MEELKSYAFALLSIVIAAVVVFLMDRLLKEVASKSRIYKIIATSCAGLLLGAGIWGMHVLNSKSLSMSQPMGKDIIYSLLAYAGTIGIFTFLLYIMRAVFAESVNLRDLAYKDTLTGLLNKNGMNHFWDGCKGNTKLAVLFLDLNRFKAINDSLGHHIGDLLLKEVGAELIQFTRKNRRYIYRIGGDEFVIISKNCNQKQAEQLAVRILEKTTKTYKLDDNELFISGSIGISINTGKVDRLRLLKEADSAMYSAKQLGTGRYYTYK